MTDIHTIAPDIESSKKVNEIINENTNNWEPVPPNQKYQQNDTFPFQQDQYEDQNYQQPLNNESQFMFSEKTVRLAFIRKVYAILTLQLAITAGIMSVFILVKPVNEFVQKHFWVLIIAVVLQFILLIMLACCPDVRRKTPINFILLLLFTMVEGVLLGAISATAKTEIVLMAAGITIGVAFGLTIFAFQTRWDFTMAGGILFVFLLVLFGLGIMNIFIRSQVLNTVYAAIGALLFSAYLVYDTQLMLGGKHKYSLSPEEYIFAALNLYLDIVNMFMFILALLTGGGCGNND